jgi:erythromycin esterase-like protein
MAEFADWALESPRAMDAKRSRLRLGIVGVTVGAAFWAYLYWLPPVPPVRADLPPALSRAVIPLSTDDPDAETADLAGLLPLVGSSRVVALGEATHGTREFFRLKHRVFRFLVRDAGFSVFALEISAEAGRRVDDYIRHGTGSARAAVNAFEFWTWKTEEVLALIEWMRTWNLAHPSRPLTFAGINATGARRDQQMARNVERVLHESGQDGRIVVWAHNAHVSSGDGWMGSYLRQSLGRALYIVGFEFSEGAFRSRNLFGVRDHTVGPASDDYYAADLARLGPPIVWLDFRRADGFPTVGTWLRSPRRSRDIDEFFYVTRYSERWHSRLEPWRSLYDAVIFVRRTTAARGL